MIRLPISFSPYQRFNNVGLSSKLVSLLSSYFLDRQMDFTDIIKFFNEMAEKHEAVQVLDMARQLVSTLQTMMSDK